MLIAGYTVILGSSRFLEPVWGQVEFSIFFAVVNVAAGLGKKLVIFEKSIFIVNVRFDSCGFIILENSFISSAFI